MLTLNSISRCLKRLIQPPVNRYRSTYAESNNVNSAEMSNNVNSAEMSNTSIVWIDMEMTGLDVENDRILEIACLITDKYLNVTSPDFHIILNQPDRLLDNMIDWCKEQHGESGLTQSSRKSHETEKTANDKLLNFLEKYVPKGKCPMAGNSVYMDRLFLRKYMPEANDYIHYRIIDVSSIKEVVRRWKPDIYKAAPIKLLHKHRALDDIKESIKELEYYKEHVFNAAEIC